MTAVAPVTDERRHSSRGIIIGSIVLMVVAGVLGALAAFIVPVGLPYDEPAHWSNVISYVEQGRMPVLGEPGVEYEAQQTPLFYVMAAAVAVAAGESVVAVRLLGVVGFIVLTGLTAMIAAAVSRGRTLVTIAATAFVALNPMLAVMSGSVQNDTWALVWGFFAVVLTLRPTPGPRWLQGAAVGLAASLAVLTKVSMAPLVLGIVLAYLLRRRIAEPVAVVGVTAVATGWWFVRNLVLYGDLTGQSAVVLTGAEFDNVPTGPFGLAQRVLTYLTLPTEYLRNVIEAPTWVDAAAIVVGVVLLTGLLVLAMRERRRFARWPLAVVALVAAASVAAWLVQSMFGWPVAFRTAYGALPLFALAAGTATCLGRRRAIGIGVLAVTSSAQLAATAWVLVTIATLDPAPML